MKIEDNFRLKVQQFEDKFEKNKNDNKITNNSGAFADMLKECMDNVNNEAIASNQATSAFVKGEDISIDEVMTKAAESSLSLQFLTTTRDKLVEGYKELIKMQ